MPELASLYHQQQKNRVALPHYFDLSHEGKDPVTLSVPAPSIATNCAPYFGLSLSQNCTSTEADICVTNDEHWQLTYDGEIYSARNQTELTGLLLTVLGDALVRRTRYPVFHAGGLAYRGKAVVFAGPARCGKSTLALTAWRDSISIIGDDLLIINQDLTVRAMPRVLKPRLGDDQKPQANNGGFVATVNDDRRLFIPRDPNRFCAYDQRYEVSALYFLSREPSTSINSASRIEAMRNAVLQSLIHGKINPRCVKLVDRLWQQQRIFGLGIADNDSAKALSLIMQNAE